jgi:transcriptional regulator with XRE-family HTH domain
MNTELALNFGKVIREFRKEKKISQEELGFQSNLHRTYIGMIERGEKNITLENIEKLSKGLDVSMKLIFEKLNKIH